jgi:hypothetical protein
MVARGMVKRLKKLEIRDIGCVAVVLLGGNAEVRP